MEHEIHLYMAVAQAAHAPPYQSGNCHPLLVFLRHPVGAEHDLGAAAALAMDAGWIQVDITKAGTLPQDAQAEMEEPFASRYRAAMQDGAALLIYDTVVKPAPRAKT